MFNPSGKNSTDNSSTAKMTKRYVLVLLVLAVIAFGNFFIMRERIRGEQSTAAVVNISGRQSMLLQRSAMFAQRLLIDRDDGARRRLRHSVDTMEFSHDALLHGNPSMNLPGDPSPAILAMFFEDPLKLDDAVKRYVTEARALASDPDLSLTFNNPHLVYLLRASEYDLLMALGALVQEYQIESEAEISAMKSIELWLLIVSLLVVLISGVFVFRPLVRRIEDDIKSIKSAEEKTRAVVENMFDGLIIFDEDGRIDSLNSAAGEMLGYSPGEVIGGNVKDLVPDILNTSGSDKWGVGVMREAAGVRKGGEILPVELCVSSIELGDMKSYVGMLHDIRDRKRAEEEILQKNIELIKASRLKSEFLANMSHELRTPLNAIIGFSEVLKDGVLGDLTEEQTEYITDIFESGHHLLSLVNEILDLAKIEAGRMTLDLEEVNIRELLNGSLSIVRDKAMKQRIELSVDLGNVESRGIYLDPLKFRQIIYNLLSNAVKFTPEGGVVSVKARIEKGETEDATDYLLVSVEDTGIGIRDDELQYIFNPFVQLDASKKRSYEGTGLGLVMVKRLTTLHGGTVAVKSEEGKGSVFTVSLPSRPVTGEVCLIGGEGDPRNVQA